MKKETLKELGKFGIDLSKIIFAIAILQPLLKNGTINIIAIIGGIALATGGIILINEGANDE